jgi:hypothetical protein
MIGTSRCLVDAVMADRRPFASFAGATHLRATVPHGCNPDRNVEFDSQRLGCSETE